MHRNERAVVTGATRGIGEAIARRLAGEGMTVVLVGRSRDALDTSMRRIDAAVPGADLRTELADLSLLREVRELAGRLAGQPPPDVVVSNAAVITDIKDRTDEGLQRMLAVNHLAPYLLLRSLVPVVDGRRTRFVVVGASPTGLKVAPVDLDDLGFTSARALGPVPSFRPFAAYARTKNMNTMFVYALARRLAGTGITVNGAHPGIIKGTGLGREARGLLRLFGNVQRVGPVLAGVDAGADTPSWLATTPEVEGVTGRFYVKRRAVPTAAHTTDEARCDRLWNESARLVDLGVTV